MNSVVTSSSPRVKVTRNVCCPNYSYRGTRLMLLQDLEQLITVSKTMPSLHRFIAYSQDYENVISSLMPKYHRWDTCLILEALSLLIQLVSDETRDAQREDLRSTITKLWDDARPIPHSKLLSTDVSFIYLHLGIEGGSQVPFLALYSSSTQESFNHRQMYMNSNRQGPSLQCMQFPSPQNRRHS